ncbi:uncharacterized protein LOC116019596 [Ipomoea triloba]|uniref:uncharacterized protein LOC116019596 n=1 Tax=Ipomoea triloba TaxID=35885 RepID=UPI00125D255F|nr:uncharacterized protein LOC116019596 [Ipomoea triloba]
MQLPVGFISVHTDAVVFLETQEVTFGVIIKDNRGEYIAAKSGHLRCLLDAHIAEAVAIRVALSWVKERGHSKVMMYTDCQMVCKLFNGNLLDLSFAGCVINDCRELSRHFESVSVKFISRSVNKAAHVLARAARSLVRLFGILLFLLVLNNLFNE